MSTAITNNSGGTLYYLERKQTGWSPDVYQWGSDDPNTYSWVAWQAQSLTNGTQKWFSGDRQSILFHTEDISVANVAAGDAFVADTAIWKSGFHDSNIYTWDTGNGTSHNGGSNTWLAYKGSYNSPVDQAVPPEAPKHTRESKGDIAKNYIFDYYKLAQYENNYETDSNTGAIKPPPLRVILGQTPYIRGQDAEQFYKITLT